MLSEKIKKHASNLGEAMVEFGVIFSIAALGTLHYYNTEYYNEIKNINTSVVEYNRVRELPVMEPVEIKPYLYGKYYIKRNYRGQE